MLTIVIKNLDEKKLREICSTFAKDGKLEEMVSALMDKPFIPESLEKGNAIISLAMDDVALIPVNELFTEELVMKVITENSNSPFPPKVLTFEEFMAQSERAKNEVLTPEEKEKIKKSMEKLKALVNIFKELKGEING